MKPLRWWVPVACAGVALASGLVPYALLSSAGKIPPGLRDNPWPMELVAVAATVLGVLIAIRAYREKSVRAAATVGAALATLGTTGFLFLVHVATYELPPSPKELAVGTAAPDFTLPDEGGRPVSLASSRGQPTLLVFYRGSWCPFCRSELAGLVSKAKGFEEAGVKILAVSADPKEASATMKGELGIGFPLLSDEDERVIKLYGLLHSGGRDGSDISRPAVLLLDGQGVIRWATFTDNIRVRPHPEALLEAARKLR